MKKIGIGLIGCGLIGRIHAKVIVALSDAILVAVADTNPSLTNDMNQNYGCRKYSDYNEMLKCKDIDLVSVCVPPALHYQVVSDAARAGKHVVVEKPMDISLDRIDAMIAECRQQEVMLSVIFQHRFDKVVQVVKQAVDEGQLGKLLMGSSRTIWYRDSDYYAVAWRGTQANGGGALMNQSIHYIDLLQYLMGEVDSVSSACKTLAHTQIEVEDTGIAILKFKSGALGMIEGTTIAYPGWYSELCLFGENGSVFIKDDRLVSYKIKDGTVPEFDELIKEEGSVAMAVANPEDFDQESHEKQYRDILEAVNSLREPLVNGEEGRKAVAIINAIYRASADGKWVSL